MFGTLVSAAAVCAYSLLLGQGVLRLCGARRWSSLAPAVGVSVLMLGAFPALGLPGRSVTVAVLLTVAAVACAVAIWRDPRIRPPLELLVGVPIALAGLVPFASAGTAGTLGVSLNNDMASHLIWAEAYSSRAIERVNEIEPGYPVGPHAVVAAIHETLGVATEEAFAGLTLACLVLLAWTALSTFRPERRLAGFFAASLAGVPFLIAAYYGQGSFKELLQAVFVLAFVGALVGRDGFPARTRWIPAALLVAGTLSVYSVPGLAWPVVILGVWVAGLAIEELIRHRTLRRAWGGVRAELVPLAVGAGTLLVLLAPQVVRLERFVSGNVGTNGTGIETTDLGNLVARLPVWEAFGAWDNPDYRLPAVDPFTVGMWTAFVVALVAAGAIWWIHRRDWLLPAATAASLLIWRVSDATQSPYVSAKALVVVSPMLMVLAARPLAEVALGDLSWPLVWRVATGVVAVVFAVQILGTSWDSLRITPVGPQAHLHELRELRPELAGARTLFLGNDDYIRWELAGMRVNSPVIGNQGISTRPEKPWEYGQPFDLDSLEPAELNKYDWIITPRDAAGSDPPKELRLVRSTRSFQLWRRTGQIQPRKLLEEGAGAAAQLSCSTPAGKRVLEDGSVAGVRRPTVSAPLGAVPAGGTHEVPLSLTPGVWDLQAGYVSQHPIDVTAGGLHAVLPANLDRPGPRWPVGRIRVAKAGPVVVGIYVRRKRATPPGVAASIDGILATPENPTRVVPVRRACGRLVDWYR